MPTTQLDIAEHLSVSRSIVAQVLAGHPKTRASPETRRRILQAAKDLDYRPNAAAIALRRGKTNVVGFVFCAPSHPNYSSLLDPLAMTLGSGGYSVLTRSFPTQGETLLGLQYMVSSRACDLIVLSGKSVQVEEQGDLLERLGMPFVAVGRFERSHPGWHQIDYDHEQMMSRAVDHLANVGHQKISFLGYANSEPYNLCLIDGFCSAYLRRFSVPLHPRLFALAGPYEMNYDDAVVRLLALPEDIRPTSLVVGAGTGGWHGTARALARAGIAMGDGEDEFAVAGMATTPLYLAFGYGHAFMMTNWAGLGSIMADRLLLPLLRMDRVELTIIRVCPDLQK